MSSNPRKNTNLHKLVTALYRTGNIAQAIQDANLQPGRAHQILRGIRARKLLQQYRQLATLHKELALAHVSSQALATLLHHLNTPDDPNRQLRSALSLLKLTPPKRTAADLTEFDYDPKKEGPY